MDKDLKKILQAIVKAGYVVVVNKNGHLVIYTQDGERGTTFSGTASDFRSLRNALAPLKRRGFRWPPRG